ncbi:MAG: Crp/Fnr family transcriptional regulator [Acidobacteriaceae bacterium]|nr:Crp/Fnr family transcriptional regulator [Acidobacteriaceae bacterium]MBV8572458.1 Crp/Fnr family transcriptional regulator [Acidobacteriaceae bacterium]
MRENAIEQLERAAQAYPFLSDLSPEHLSRLLATAEERFFEPDEVLFGEGARSEFLYLIAKGRIALETVSAGAPIIIQTLTEGDAMGWSALTKSGKTHFQARAISSVQTIAFDGAKLSLAFDYDNSFGYQMMKRLLEMVTDRLDRTRLQMIELYTNSKGTNI